MGTCGWVGAVRRDEPRGLEIALMHLQRAFMRKVTRMHAHKTE
mgnify:CR=1 FL=1